MKLDLIHKTKEKIRSTLLNFVELITLVLNSPLNLSIKEYPIGRGDGENEP